MRNGAFVAGPARDQHAGVVRGGRHEARRGGERRGEETALRRARRRAQATGARQRPPGRLETKSSWLSLGWNTQWI
ncbi:unnamed protein product [Parnassius apollo]|uniref:(apollo) hypothetical protein n=1 Tax=Parnassius apollo TaxID=110799 RepID=A0A8S3Y113_PARAO|nr:unnamed protein product [Parnassius apollo]